MKIVYPLIATAKQFYSTLARLSVTTVRISNPEIEICLLTDKKTFNEMQSERDPLICAVDDIVVINVTHEDPRIASRYLKTTARNYFEGMILVIDCDTIIRKKFPQDMLAGASLAGAANFSADNFCEQVDATDSALLKHLGWDIREDFFINAGVLLYAADEAAREFASLWHEIWDNYRIQQLDYRDQVCFNRALFLSKINFKILSHSYNAQIKERPETGSDAIVWHYYSSETQTPKTAFETYAFTKVGGLEIEHSEIQEMLSRGEP